MSSGSTALHGSAATANEGTSVAQLTLGYDVLGNFWDYKLLVK